MGAVQINIKTHDTMLVSVIKLAQNLVYVYLSMVSQKLQSSPVPIIALDNSRTFIENLRVMKSN